MLLGIGRNWDRDENALEGIIHQYFSFTAFLGTSEQNTERSSILPATI